MIVRQQAQRSHRHAVGAWSVVAACALMAVAAAAWTSSHLAKADADVRHLTEYADQVRQASKALETERDTARQQAVAADRNAAESSGKLTAYVEQNQKMAEIMAQARPTTRPAGLMQQLVEAMAR